MSNIAALPGLAIPIAQGGQNERLVEILEELLAEAKTGHLTGAAFALYRSSGKISTAWDAGRNNVEVAAAVLMLHQGYAQALCE